MGRAIGLLGALVLLGAPAPAQVVQYWAPAFSNVQGGVSPVTSSWYVFEGVPGERMRVRVHPEMPAYAADWVADLVQPDVATQSFVPGPGGTIVLDQVEFGPAGVVAVNVRALGEYGGQFVLRARSKLPPGYAHPAVNLLPGDPPLAAIDTGLRPGLQLRVRVRLPHQAQDWPADALPQVLFTPPPLAGVPVPGYVSLPSADEGKAYPDVATLLVPFESGYTAEYAHAAFTLPLAEVDVLGARVRRQKLKLGYSPKSGSGPSAESSPVPPHSSPFWEVQLDQTELLPGSSAHLTASFGYQEDDGCPDQTATVQVWLSSLHRIDTAHLDGVLLAGPVEVPLVQYSTPFETDIVLPADLAPGLWGVWVVLDEADAPFFTCDNRYHGAAGATVLKVLVP